MRRFLLVCGIISTLPFLILNSAADEAQNINKEDNSGFSWSGLGRDLTNLGLGALDTNTGVLSDLKIGILDSISNSNINPFFIFDRFLNQTRSTIPIIANHGNFTLLQAALLCAVGSLAAGAGAIALEAFYFKTVNDQTLAYEHQQEYYATHSAYGAPAQPAYGAPAYGAPVQPAYGAPVQPAYGSPAHQRRDIKIPPRIVRPIPTLSAKRLKPQSLRRTQRRNQRKNQYSVGGYQSPHSGPGLKRRKRQAYNYNYPVYPTVAPRTFTQYLTSYFNDPFQSFQPKDSYPSQSLNPYLYSNINQNQNNRNDQKPPRSDSETGWFGFRFPTLNRNKNLINRSFQRYT